MQLKHFECDTVCGFMVQGYDKDEISKIATDHVKKSHASANITDEMVQGLITTIETEPESK
jgi:predicted small metal-binding protein